MCVVSKGIGYLHICCSWVSHYPEGYTAGRVAGRALARGWNEGWGGCLLSAKALETHTSASLGVRRVGVVTKGVGDLHFCSSWVSHFPEECTAGRVAGRRALFCKCHAQGYDWKRNVVYHPLLCNFACSLSCSGLGMNQDELARNKQLTEYSVRDLNSDPKLPYEDNSFDVITNCVSVDYLTQPLEVGCGSDCNSACKGKSYYAHWQVFKGMHLLLKPGTESNFSRSSQQSLQSLSETCSHFSSLAGLQGDAPRAQARRHRHHELQQQVLPHQGHFGMDTDGRRGPHLVRTGCEVQGR